LTAPEEQERENGGMGERLKWEIGILNILRSPPGRGRGGLKKITNHKSYANF